MGLWRSRRDIEVYVRPQARETRKQGMMDSANAYEAHAHEFLLGRDQPGSVGTLLAHAVNAYDVPRVGRS